jgi:hypothetical protein
MIRPVIAIGMPGEDDIPAIPNNLNEAVIPLQIGVDPGDIPDVIGGFLTPAAYFLTDPGL